MSYPENDLESFCYKYDVTLVYFTSGSYGNIFKAISNSTNEIKFAVKIIPNKKEDYHGPITDQTHPVFVEMKMVNLLADLDVKFFCKPIDTFYTDIKPFINLPSYNKV